MVLHIDSDAVSRLLSTDYYYAVPIDNVNPVQNDNIPPSASGKELGLINQD